MILETIYEPVHGRSCHTALKGTRSVVTKFQGRNWWIETGLSLSAVTKRERLIDILLNKISDQRFLECFRKFLNAGYFDKLRFF